MSKENNSIHREKLFTYISIILVIIIVVLSGLYLFLTIGDAGSNTVSIAKEYKNITSTKAFEIYNDYINDEYNNNLTIIDSRNVYYSCGSCAKSNYDVSHIPGAILENYPKAQEYYNTTSDFIIYTHNGQEYGSRDFCQGLVGHVRGNIYFIEDGYTAWVEAGYPTESS